MNEFEIIESMNNRLLTVEVIVNQLHDTLVSNGVIDKVEFDKSLNEKVKNLKRIADSLKSNSTETLNSTNLFGGPIGEA